MSSPETIASWIAVCVPLLPPVLVEPTETDPPLLSAVETPPLPPAAASMYCADATPTNAVEAIAAIASPVTSLLFIGSSPPLSRCPPPLARVRASRLGSSRACHPTACGRVLAYTQQRRCQATCVPIAQVYRRQPARGNALLCV